MPGARRLLLVSGFFGLKMPAAPPRSPPTSCARAEEGQAIESMAPVKSNAEVKKPERIILSDFIAYLSSNRINISCTLVSYENSPPHSHIKFRKGQKLPRVLGQSS